MGVAELARHLAREQVHRGDVAEQRDLAVLHGKVDVLAAPGQLARVQRRQNGDGTEEPAGKVAHGHTGANGRAAGLAGNRHAAAVALGHHVEGSAVAVGTLFAEAGYAAGDDAGVDRSERRVVDAEPLGHGGTKIVDDDIRLGGEFVKEGAPSRLLQVDADALLVAVQRAEVGPHALVGVTGVVGEEGAGHLAGAGGSTLIVCAPRSASSIAANGPDSMCVRSSITMSERAFIGGVEGVAAGGSTLWPGPAAGQCGPPQETPRDTIARPRQVGRRREWQRRRSAGA